MIPLRSKARRSAEQTREHVLDVAYDLFYWHGIRATGVDRVAAEAGIAPTALYRLFPSKDALVASLRGTHRAALSRLVRSDYDRGLPPSRRTRRCAVRRAARTDAPRRVSRLPVHDGAQRAARRKLGRASQRGSPQKVVRARLKDSPKTTPALTRAETSTRVPLPITSACCSKVSMPPCKRSAMTGPPSELANSP